MSDLDLIGVIDEVPLGDRIPPTYKYSDSYGGRYNYGTNQYLLADFMGIASIYMLN